MNTDLLSLIILFSGQFVVNAQTFGKKGDERLINIGAKVVKHSRYVVFQMAEVIVPRALFREILERIGQLRVSIESAGMG
jgi:hypothetical protein